MKLFKTLIFLSCVSSIVLAGCQSVETQKVTKISQKSTSSKKNVDDSTSKETTTSDDVETTESSDESTTPKKTTSSAKSHLSPKKTYSSISKFVEDEFESQKVNEDKQLRNDILADLKSAMSDASSMSSLEVSIKYFMSSNADRFVVRAKNGFSLDEGSLVVHDSKTEGVTEWAILLKNGSREKILSGYRNQMGQMPITYSE